HQRCAERPHRPQGMRAPRRPAEWCASIGGGSGNLAEGQPRRKQRNTSPDRRRIERGRCCGASSRASAEEWRSSETGVPMSRAAQFDVVGLGLNATDTLLVVPHFPAYAGKAPFHQEILSPGGQVASAMVTCASLGLKTKYIGTVGDDRSEE